MTQIEKNIELWKKKLLDLSKRNPLLFFKHTKRSHLQIIDPSPDALFSSLVIKEKTMEFCYRELDWKSLGLFESNDNTIPLSTFPLKPKQILTDRNDNDLFITLNNLKNKAKLSQEELGVNILFLACGFLHWKESRTSNIYYKSPLLMVPVSLTQDSLKDLFCLKLLDDDIITNPTLSFMMEKQYNIALPGYSEEDEIELSDYFDCINKLSLPADWKIINETYLGLFSFNKMTMYQDLHENVTKVSQHFLIKAFSGQKETINPIPDELQHFNHDSVSPLDTFEVLDADSSQLDAITATSKGHSIILLGPPGTGKSQTIANIIADSLARKKKVLFVSEKTAALNVVYSRLKGAKLSRFCLQLHSTKMNKKEIIKNLHQTLSENKISMTNDAYHELAIHEQNRTCLNNYVTALHEKILPLNKSIYEIHGKFLRYRNFPDLIFFIRDIKNLTQQDLDHFVEVLEEFVRSSKKPGNSYQSNCWYGSNIPELTRNTQHEMEAVYKKYHTRLTQYLNEFDSFNKHFKLPINPSYNNLASLLQILEHLTKSPFPIYTWFESYGIPECIKKTKTINKLFDTYKNEKIALTSRYKENFLSLKAGHILKELRQIKTKLSTLVKDHIIDSLLLSDSQPYLIFQSSFQDFLKYHQLALSIAKDLELSSVKTIQDSKTLYQILRILIFQPNPKPYWLNKDHIIEIKNLFQSLRKIVADVSIENELTQIYDQSILELDMNALIKRFRTDYNTALKWLKPSYYNDRKMLCSLCIDNHVKNSDDDWIKVFISIRKIHHGKKWLSQHEAFLIQCFGPNYQHLQTNCSDLEKSIDAIAKLFEIFPDKLPPTITKILMSPTEYYPLLNITGPAYCRLHESNLTQKISEYLKAPSLELTIIQEDSHKALNLLKELRCCYQSSAECLITPEIASYSQLEKDFKNLNLLQKHYHSITKLEQFNQEFYGHFFQGENTNWNHIHEVLHWCSKLSSLIPVLSNESNDFIKAVCENESTIHLSKKLLNDTFMFIEDSKNDFNYIKSKFDFSTISFNEASLTELQRWINECVNHFSLLEEWIDFRHAREACEKKGLKEFCDQLIEQNISPHDIMGSFYKRLYLLILDEMYDVLPVVKNFRSKKHRSAIEKFISTDQSLFGISQLRVNEICMTDRPSLNAFTMNTGEIGILNKEINKKKRIKPLRILFKEIPNLLLSIKPCFMMSPLSVSLLLDPSLYQFDIIIFDEASQIRTEDAIGSIYRGKQIVIAGDSEQLPPSSFFSANSFDNDDEYDENLDNDIDSYESILDQARTALPEISLLWHYRSKHEHLISFSNTMIYDHRLVTFPSLFGKAKDMGVEYYHVIDGCYDRGKKRHNLKEAEKIVEMIIDHIQHRPDLSLGIVALSNAQQQAIEESLRRYRLHNPEYESYFADHHGESFFIKNLETVQGDERDVIIFSIGYAKDASGAMTMNFGPLNTTGGYRRLNVAITRAKYNLKLVGSILPEDIDLAKTDARGAKLLRKYLEYAIYGPEAISSDQHQSIIGKTESPFEEEVLRFLLDNNFTVDSQVGCSGFRIDLAIRDPQIEGKYVLGIECDGASYHSARTARERDRLRQALLEERGWKLYRIWSTDWVKDFPSESKKLLNAVKLALSCTDHPNPGVVPQKYNAHEITEETPQYFELIDHNKQSMSEFYGFQTYIKFNIDDYLSKHFDDPTNITKCKTIDCNSKFCPDRKHCIRDKALLDTVFALLETQGPTHFDELCKSLVLFFCREKATAPVKEKILTILLTTNSKNNIVHRNSFCYLKSHPIIVRSSNGEGSTRTIEQICPEEIQLAIQEIKNKHIGIENNEIITETAKIFGFNRSGSKIQKIIIQASSHHRNNHPQVDIHRQGDIHQGDGSLVTKH